MKSQIAPKLPPQGQFVLENRRGEIVRAIRWDHPQLAVVYREDTRRIETYASTQELEEQEIPFQLLAETSRAEVQKQPLKIGTLGQIKWIEDAKNFSPSHELAQQQEKLPDYLRIAAIAHVGLIFVVLVLNHFFGPSQEVTQTQTVTVIPQEMMEMTKEDLQKTAAVTKERPQAPRQTVAAAIEKPIPQKISKDVKISDRNRQGKKLPKVAGRRIKGGGEAFGTGHGKGKTGAIGYAGPNAVESMGALGVLSRASGRASNPYGGGGLNLNAVKNERGTGLGGGPGKGNGNGGGNPHALLGKGLVAAAPGMGNGSGHGIGTPGAVGSGYGTRGKGAGNAGYGSYRLGGSAKGSSQYAGNGYGSGAYNPFANSAYGEDEEMTVAGGLSRDQIADVINRNMGQVTFCYEQGLQVKPSLAGRVAIKFVIGGQGRVGIANISHSSVHSSQVENCIVGRLKSWKFPKPVGNVNVKVTYPFVLKRVSQG